MVKIPIFNGTFLKIHFHVKSYCILYSTHQSCPHVRFLLGCNTGGQENLQRNDRESINTRFWQTLAFCKMTTPPEHRSCQTSPGSILQRINMEPKNGLGRCFSDAKRVFSGEPLVFGGVYTLQTNDGFFT